MSLLAAETPIEAPSSTKSGIVSSANELSSSMNCVAMSASAVGPLKITRKATATSASPHAMGKPEKRTAVVTTTISRPIWSSFTLRSLSGDGQALLHGRLAKHLGHVLERGQAKADRHQREERPPRRVPRGAAHLVLVPRLEREAEAFPCEVQAYQDPEHGQG